MTIGGSAFTAAPFARYKLAAATAVAPKAILSGAKAPLPFRA